MVRRFIDYFRNPTTINMILGSPIQKISIFAVPLLFANLFQQLYNMIDIMIIGRYINTNALASVGVTSPIIQLLIGLIIGLTSGISLVVARHYGAGNIAMTRKNIINGFYIIVFISILITILGLLLSHSLFKLIHTSEELMEGALIYSSILFAGAITTGIYNYEAAVLRAFGNSAIPLIFLIISSLLNVVLDLFFVLILKLGIAGVAVATIISQTVSCILCFIYLKNNFKILIFKKEDFQLNYSMIFEQLKSGLPIAFFQSLLSVSFFFTQSALNTLGNNEVAAYTIAVKMDTLTMQILAAFGTAISTFTAQNYGNNTFDRIKSGMISCLKITISISIIIALIAYFYGEYFMFLFVGNNADKVINLGVLYIQFTSIFYVILGINFVIRFVLIGAGQVFIPFGIGILEIILRAFSTYFLIYPLGFIGMVYTNPLCWGVSTFLILILYPYLMKQAFNKKLNSGFNEIFYEKH